MVVFVGYALHCEGMGVKERELKPEGRSITMNGSESGRFVEIMECCERKADLLIRWDACQCGAKGRNSRDQKGYPMKTTSDNRHIQCLPDMSLQQTTSSASVETRAPNSNLRYCRSCDKFKEQNCFVNLKRCGFTMTCDTCRFRERSKFWSNAFFAAHNRRDEREKEVTQEGMHFPRNEDQS